jgi:hypothetical protein
MYHADLLVHILLLGNTQGHGILLVLCVSSVYVFCTVVGGAIPSTFALYNHVEDN